ncbi:MAG: AzlC family ABC transporter permease [Bacillota bacterium]
MEARTCNSAAEISAGEHQPEAPLKFADGLRAGIPIAVGYVPIAIAFGLLAKSAEIPNYITILMSLVVFAGASQFVGVTMMASGVTPWEIVLTTFIVNLRHLLMSASISRRIEQGRLRRWMPALAFGITDETFSVASFRKEPLLSPQFVMALNFLAFAAWNAGTWAGIFLAGELPAVIRDSMGIALYAMFIGLLVPSLRDSKPVLAVSLVAVGVHSIIGWIPFFSGLSAGWGIIISTLAAAMAGAVIFTGEAEQ